MCDIKNCYESRGSRYSTLHYVFGKTFANSRKFITNSISNNRVTGIRDRNLRADNT